MKKVILWILFIALLLFSIGAASYPLVSNYLNSLNIQSEVINYLESANNMDDEEYSEILAEAIEYNNSLVGKVFSGDPFSQPNDNNAEYESLLNLDGTPAMGAVEIPAIDINLPIYHGTSEETLIKGIGHLSTSSLPVGGAGTHAVLTGHTGYSDLKLFTDLNQLKEGDVFFIHCLRNTLAYQVDSINVVLPTETDLLQIDPEQDYVTLVTCTPYGVNSHRLLVRGTRIPYEEAEKLTADTQQTDSTWSNEYIQAIIFGLSVTFVVVVVFLLVLLILHLRRKRKKNE